MWFSFEKMKFKSLQVILLLYIKISRNFETLTLRTFEHFNYKISNNYIIKEENKESILGGSLCIIYYLARRTPSYDWQM